MRVLLGISGSIAAYKAIILVRRLVEAGAEVRVVLTESAQAFVTPLSLQAVSGHPVRSALFDPEAEAGMDHIALARWADTILVAPASAGLIARLAAGMADDLLSTLILATTAPVILAPAMNQQMWLHQAVQANLGTLRARGVEIWAPAAGGQACGEVGPGRLLEPEELAARLLQRPHSAIDWRGQQIVVTAGGTREPIDPVRFIANRSSGKMGHALAEAAARTGATVTLISTAHALPTPAGVRRVPVDTALQMQAAVAAETSMDLFIGAAAVADYRVETPATHKLKKTPDTNTLTLTLVKNPDIIHEVATRPNRPFVVGFAAETDDLHAQAEAKRLAKNLDMICANWVGDGQGFEQDDNALWVRWAGGQQALPSAPKTTLARQLIERIAHCRQTN
ncbi:bifunctional phosphopantothenoylcysteine decarboxylase/phosphopantothenate--cysteine ligase CoaBC [Halothiobacillus sp. DCM-1]|uniref:bifunctional phosphopantothenoylcysteine decarboxylase/phosphopantothenate--cysteine ligase CoaBC n=1 Tax=Halothiobacillus sp. DCM-1 TaxID=3112558 RepID=UPI0032499C8D